MRAEPFTPAGERARAAALVAQISGSSWLSGDAAQTADAVEPAWKYRVHPYFGFDNDDADAVQTSEIEYFAKPRAQWTYDIVVLGGSVSQAFAKFGKRKLELKLEADPRFAGWEVRVFNQGRGGFRQPQQLHALEYLLDIGYRPDAVIDLDGFNEVALGLQNARLKIHPALPSASHWAHLASPAPGRAKLDLMLAMRREQVDSERMLASADAWHLFASALTSRLVLSRLSDARSRYSDAHSAYEVALTSEADSAYFRGPTFDGTDDAALEICARIWRDSSIAMNAVCGVHSIRYLHCLQPTLHDEGSKPATPEESKDGAEPAEWALGARLGYPKLRAQSASLSAAGVQFLDLSRAFEHVDERLYNDICHFSADGVHMLVEQVADALLEHPPAPPPVNAPPRAARDKQQPEVDEEQ